MRILDLAFKDVYQILRDKLSLLFLVAMPIVFTLFMGYAYSSGESGETRDDRIPLGWVNHDPDGYMSQELYQLLSHSESLKLIELQAEVVEEAVLEGEVAGALLVPGDFSLASREGRSRLTLVVDSSSTTAKSLYQLVRTPVTHLSSAIEIADLSLEMVARSGDKAVWQAAFDGALQAWALSDSQAYVRYESAVGQGEQPWFGDNPYNQASPGILVQFAIFGLVTSGQILVQERKSRTLQRMMTTSLRPWQVITGHTLAMFAIVFLQVVLLLVFGQLVLGVNYLREPLGVLLVSIAVGLWVAAMGLLISTVAKDDSQVVLLSLISMFIFSGLGGTWFPLETAGTTFAAVGRLMPSTWAMMGYQNLLIRGLGLESVWLPVAVLMLFAIAFFILAVWRYRRLSI